MSDERGRYGFYFVAYIDVLGQRDELRRLTELAINEESHAETMEVLDRTAGRVRTVREAFFGQAARMRRWQETATTAEQRERVKQIVPEFHQIGFSDSFVVSTCIGGTEPMAIPRAVHGIFISMVTVATVSLVGLSRGVPLRAGIDVERAINIYDNEVYGPALINAYRLECEVAQYPRAVIGNGLLRFLDAMEATSGDDPEVRLGRQFASDCRELIYRAPDGQNMLDILAPVVLEAFPLPERVVAPARNWVADQVRRFRLERNDKLTSRYSELYRYFELRGQVS